MQDQDAKILRGAAIPTLVVGVVVTAVFAYLSGADGLLGAALGTLVVLAFFSLSWFVISKASESGPTMMMGAAFGTYLVKIVLLGILLVSFRETSAFDFQAFAWAILLGTLVFMGFQVRAFLRQRMLYVDPDRSSP
jgi:ATP synthase protein I